MAKTKTKTTGRKPRQPKLCHHKGNGQAYITVSGRQVCLGPHGTPTAHARYAEAMRVMAAARDEGRDPLDAVLAWKVGDGGRVGGPAVSVAQARFTVADMSRAYLDYLDGAGRYTKNGERTSQRIMVEKALDELAEVAGTMAVHRFGEAALLQHRDRLEAGPRLSRGGINRKVSLIKGAFKWAKTRGLCPKQVWADLREVEPLQRHETGGRPEPERRQPVTPKQLEAVLPQCNRQIAAMLRLQWATGMRPGEVCAMRWAEVDRTPIVVGGVECWTYRVASGKTQHHGQATVYPLNPVCQGILAEFQKPPTAYIFSPKDAARELSQKRRANRKTKITDYTAKRDAQATRIYADRFSTTVYRQHVQRACRAAGVAPFSPHCLRHSFVTWAANDASLGAAAAGAAVNHKNRQTTEGYIHADQRLAYRVAAAAMGRRFG